MPLEVVTFNGNFAFKRGTSTKNNAFVGEDGTLSINETTGEVHLHNGTTPGGWGKLAPIFSPNFAGIPTAPTASDSGTRNTQIASTDFVHGVVGGLYEHAITADEIAAGSMTLSASDIANATLKFTGILTDDFIVYIPSLPTKYKRPWTVFNSTTGQNLVSSSGKVIKFRIVGSAVEVPVVAGKTKIIFQSTGNLVDANLSPVPGGLLERTITTEEAAAGAITLTDAEASFAVLRFAGTLTKKVVITVPTGVYKRMWAVFNKTDGGFDIALRVDTSAIEIPVGTNKARVMFASKNDMADAYNDFRDVELTGTPTAPTQTQGTDTTAVANCAFVNNVVGGVQTRAITTAEATSGAITLTAAEAANATLRITGTLTKKVTVTIPTTTNKRLYALLNLTSGGYPVEFKTDLSSAVVSVSPGMSKTGFASASDFVEATTQLTGTLIEQSKYRQAPDQSGTGAIVLDYNKGDLFKVTATGAVQISLSGMPSGYVGTLILDAVNFGAYTITWPSGTKWPGGTAPTMTTSGTDRVEFIVNAAGVIYASVIGKDFK